MENDEIIIKVGDNFEKEWQHEVWENLQKKVRI